MAASPSGVRAGAALLLLSILPMGLAAQVIYRCGNSYGQTPCPGGSVLAIDDSRSAQQKAQTDAATAQAARLGDRMERERLMQARAALANPAPARAAPVAAKEKASHPRKRASASEPPAPPYFTAASGRNDRKKSAARSGN